MSEHMEDTMNKGTMTNSNLKPCPHCGENAWHRAIAIGKSAISVIECTSCGASSNNEEQWNKRTTDQLRTALRDCVEQMETARQFIVNGTELGYIKMPDVSTDRAHETLPAIKATITNARKALGEQ